MQQLNLQVLRLDSNSDVHMVVYRFGNTISSALLTSRLQEQKQQQTAIRPISKQRCFIKLWTFIKFGHVVKRYWANYIP